MASLTTTPIDITSGQIIEKDVNSNVDITKISEDDIKKAETFLNAENNKNISTTSTTASTTSNKSVTIDGKPFKIITTKPGQITVIYEVEKRAIAFGGRKSRRRGKRKSNKLRRKLRRKSRRLKRKKSKKKK